MYINVLKKKTVCQTSFYQKTCWASRKIKKNTLDKNLLAQQVFDKNLFGKQLFCNKPVGWACFWPTGFVLFPPWVSGIFFKTLYKWISFLLNRNFWLNKCKKNVPLTGFYQKKPERPMFFWVKTCLANRFFCTYWVKTFKKDEVQLSQELTHLLEKCFKKINTYLII